MYLRQSKQKRADGREITYLQLAENVWDATKGRSQAQIVFNCGRADDPEVIERLRRLATVAPTEEIEDVLATMRGNGTHLARVVDPTGEVIGVIFLEDIVEELVGTISDAETR